MDLQPAYLFKSADAIKNDWIKKHSGHALSLNEEWRELTAIFEKDKTTRL